jgi:hypothetical protein
MAILSNKLDGPRFGVEIVLALRHLLDLKTESLACR